MWETQRVYKGPVEKSREVLVIVQLQTTEAHTCKLYSKDTATLAVVLVYCLSTVFYTQHTTRHFIIRHLIIVFWWCSVADQLFPKNSRRNKKNYEVTRPR